MTDEKESQGYDEADGIRNFMRYMGRYKPKKQEQGELDTGGPLSDYEDPDDHIFQLLRATAPGAEWREGLRFMMKEDREDILRRKLAFLHNNAAAGINLIDDGAPLGTSVDIDADSAPSEINCADWMKVMDGLGFELTSPGTVRNVDYVDVAISGKTNRKALQGFCCLMHSMLDLSWSNLQTLSKLQHDEGNHLWETVSMLRSGSGIHESSRAQLEKLEIYPYLMKSLGFQSHKNRLRWERPKSEEFDRLSWSLHGLFRRTDVIESPV